MATSTILSHVRIGMQPQSADGKGLGTITGVCSHDTETYVEVTTGPWLPLWLHIGHTACVYLPGSAVTAVVGQRVSLSMDAKTARHCTLRPNWFAGPTTANLQFW